MMGKSLKLKSFLKAFKYVLEFKIDQCTTVITVAVKVVVFIVRKLLLVN